MVFDINDANIVDCPTNGAWTASNEANRFTYNAGRILILKPLHQLLLWQNRNCRIGFWSKPKTVMGEKKSQDIIHEVGSFQVALTAPRK
jgi:hypothetical protein